MHEQQKRLVGFGIGLGLCFPLIAIPIDILYRDLDMGWSAAGLVHQENPLHWIVDSAPLVLGTIFYFLGKSIARHEHELLTLNEVMHQRCQNISGFVKALNQDNFTLEVQDRDDEIITSLTHFRDNLADKNRLEKKRTWINEGLATFSDLLRIEADDIPAFCQNILSHLIQYIGMSQGAIFVLDDTDEEPCLELTACYAWDKKRYVNRKILPGESLVGQCWIEQEKIYLTHVPEDYISITSGLGKSLPRVVIILPLKTKEKIMGVVELASFKPIEDFHIEFLEKICESIASVLQSLMVTGQIRALLQKTQEQTESLQAQEEEMRQSMEEMQATQEAADRNQKKVQAIFTSATDGIVVMNSLGRVEMFNPAAEAMFGYLAQDMEGQPFEKLFVPSTVDDKTDQLTSVLLVGKPQTVEAKRKDGQVFLAELQVQESLVGSQQVFVGIVRDLTQDERYRANENLMRERIQQIEQKAYNQLAKLREKYKKQLAERDQEIELLKQTLGGSATSH